MKSLLLASLFLIQPLYAGQRIISGNYDEKDTAAIDLNFDDIRNDLSGTVHKTSTETIRGFKYFTNNTDFSTISVDSITLTNIGSIATKLVRQVAFATTTTSTNTTSTSFIDTGLSVNITPSNSNSQILILVFQNVGAVLTFAGNVAEVILQISRNGTGVSGSMRTLYMTALVNGSTIHSTVAIGYLDSPNTTSQVTYKTQFARSGSSNGVTHYCQGNTGQSMIFAIEVLP